MRARVTRLVVAAALVCATSGAARAQLLSPGPLSKAHAGLEGDSHCSDCHTSGKKLDDGKCLSCHDDLGRRIAARAGLHGRNYRGQKCEKCHVEHIGRGGRLVRWPGGTPSKLDHRLTGWTLGGGHRQVACADCHKTRNKRGNATYIGLKTACGSCHKDPHKGRFGATCETCHSDAKWKTVVLDKFDHDKTRYPLKGKHLQVDCKKCHGEPATYTGIKFAACDFCHKDPHAGKMKQACADCHTEKSWSDIGQFKHPGLSLRNGHKRVKCERCHDRGNTRAPSKGRSCVACHKPVHRARFGRNCKTCHRAIKWLGLPDKIGFNAHGKTRYPLAGRHRKVECDSCHSKKLSPPKRYRAIQFDRCGDCHADKHAGEFTDRDRGECAACHTLAGFRPTSFGVAQHATTRFALDGGHVAAPCASCHESARPRLDLRIAEHACANCHDNPHGDKFAAEMHKGGCATCHGTGNWHNPKVDHSTWPLDGAHARAVCAACHGKDEGARKAVYKGTPRECAGCHLDPHAGQFRVNAPFRPCVDCHTTSAFRIPHFDHDRLTTFALTGKHKQVACGKCHERSKLRNGRTAIRYRLYYQACADCHADPH